MNRIVFVGSNPSKIGPESPAKKTLYAWYNMLGVVEPIFVNVSNRVTPDNWPLKKREYELKELAAAIACSYKVVALGNTASDALKRIGTPHFKLPHPSPKNRKLNDKDEVKFQLALCRTYLEL